LIGDLIDRHQFARALIEIRRLGQDDISILSAVASGRLSLYAADALYHSGNYDEALRYINKSIECLRHTDAHSLYGRAKYRRGYILLTTGDYSKGADDFREARFAYKRVEDTSGELAACSCLARCAFGEGQYLKASEYLERSIDLCKRLDDHFRLHAMEANLARVLTSLGDFRAAERCFKNIDAAVQSVSLISRCNYDGSLGYLFVLMRKFEKAAIHILRSRNLAFENGLTRQIATSHEYAGELAFWQGDYAKAEEHYWEAIRIGMEIAPEGDLISQSYRLLAELQVARDQLDDAEESCNRAWTVAEKINERLELGAIRRTRGEIAARRGDAGAAKIAFEESIRILSEIGAKYELARVHLQAGEAGVFSSEYRLTNL